jgi:hypothetical protein
MTFEGRIKADCLRYLERHGFFVWNNPTGCVRIAPARWVSFGKKGSADILGCLPGGKFLAIEVKAAHGRLSPEQQEFIQKIRGNGGLALVVRSWKELDQALMKAGYTMKDMPLFEETNAALYSEESNKNR